MTAGKNRVFACVLGASLALAACGDDDSDANSDPKVDAGTSGEEDASTAGQTVSITSTLVPITADDNSAPILTPHEVELYDSATGKPLSPAVKGTTSSKDGTITNKIPVDKVVAIYIKGEGAKDEPTSTYDTMIVNYNPDAKETLLRISSAGTKSLAESTAVFKSRDDRAALTGAIYWTPGGGTIKGVVGCAKIFVDDETGAAEDYDQRYLGKSPLPATLADQDQTSRRGQFYFGNISTGEHTFKVSLDDGETFIADATVVLPFTRADAQSETKAFIYQLGFYIDLPANPTPASCPQLN
jgi:hypothetical protein